MKALRLAIIIALTTLVTLAAIAEWEYYEMAIRPFTVRDQYIYNHMSHNGIPW